MKTIDIYLDELNEEMQARFLEMFGDSINWDEIREKIPNAKIEISGDWP